MSELDNILDKVSNDIISRLKAEPGKPGRDGKTPTESEILSLIIKTLKAYQEDIKGDKGDTPIKGVDYFTEDEISRFKTEVVPIKGVDYNDGLPGEAGEMGKIPDHDWTDGKLRFETQNGWGDWIDIKKMLKEMIKKVKPAKSSILRGFGGISGSTPITESLTSQCDGSNKVFSTTYTFKSGTIQLAGQDAPFIYDPATDFTETDTNEITLTSEVDAPLINQRLVITYVRS